MGRTLRPLVRAQGLLDASLLTSFHARVEVDMGNMVTGILIPIEALRIVVGELFGRADVESGCRDKVARHVVLLDEGFNGEENSSRIRRVYLSACC